jgi:hypothetical protein
LVSSSLAYAHFATLEIQIAIAIYAFRMLTPGSPSTLRAFFSR